MIQRIFFITCLILCSCESDENKIYDIIITGTVKDQVTKLPVEGATVSVGKQRGLIPGNGLNGYAGCDRREIYYFNAQNSVLDIELHH
jgi:hypothetical protein